MKSDLKDFYVGVDLGQNPRKRFVVHVGRNAPVLGDVDDGAAGEQCVRPRRVVVRDGRVRA